MVTSIIIFMIDLPVFDFRSPFLRKEIIVVTNFQSVNIARILYPLMESRDSDESNAM